MLATLAAGFCCAVWVMGGITLPAALALVLIIFAGSLARRVVILVILLTGLNMPFVGSALVRHPASRSVSRRALTRPAGT